MSVIPELSTDSKKALQIEELTSLSRLVVNTLNLLCSNDITIPTAYARPVAEIQNWLEGMHKNIQGQLEAFGALVKPSVAEAPKDAATAQPEAKESIVEVVA